MAKFIGHNANLNVELNVELYRNGENFCAWLSDNMGGSGIEAVGETPEKLADNLSPYIADYFYEEGDEEKVATTPTIKVLCYTDETDNTKGAILTINKETDTKTDKMADLIGAELIKQGFFNKGDDLMEINEVSRQIAFLDEGKYEDYSFYFEEVSLIG